MECFLVVYLKAVGRKVWLNFQTVSILILIIYGHFVLWWAFLCYGKFVPHWVFVGGFFEKYLDVTNNGL